MCRGKKNGEDAEVAHSKSSSHREMITSVQLEVQTSAWHAKQNKPTKQAINCLRKNTEGNQTFPHVKMGSGLLTLGTGETVWRNVITS